jgi:3-phenylpropionate/trans-cinnamate dioxygenase ferredoxin subunit
MAFVKIGDAGDISPGTSRKVEVNGMAILVANVEGTFHAIANTCPHAKGDLSRGAVRDGIVTCPKHGSRFDLRTGANVGPAKFLFLKVAVKDARLFPVRVEDGEVLVEV